MKELRAYAVAACVASLAATGCSGTGVNAGIPHGNSATIHRTGTTGTISEYTIPNTDKSTFKAFPVGIANGPDGALWIAERGWGKLGRITTDGTITQYSLQSGSDPSQYPQNVTTGPDGNLWAACGTTRTYNDESQGKVDPYGSIRQMTPSGTVLQVVTLPTYNSDPRAITPGPDGNLWFTERRGAIGQVSTGGALMNEFPIQNGNAAFSIVVGPDQNLWFGETGNDIIGQITTSGVATYFTLPNGGGPAGILTGSDGYLYISEFNVGKVAQLTASGTINAEWTLGKQSYPKGLTIASDGNLYVAEFNTSKIAEIVLHGPTAGTIYEFKTPTSSSGPWTLATGTDGNVWFTESLKGQIGKLSI